MEHDPEFELQKDDLVVLLKVLPDNMGLFLEKDGDKMLFTKQSPEDFRKLGENPGLFHIIGMWTRPWVGYCVNWLEYEHFPPETPENEAFQFRVFKWHGMLWSVCSIPIEKKELAYKAAEVSHLKLADGIPIMAGAESPITMVAATRPNLMPEGFEMFPLNCDNAYTLEQKSGDVLYEGPGGAQDAKASEEYQIRKLWEKHGDADLDDGYDPWSVG